LYQREILRIMDPSELTSLLHDLISFHFKIARVNRDIIRHVETL